MKLTKIIPQVKRADRVSVFVDEEYVFSLSLDQLVASGLKAGDDILPGQIADYQQASTEGKLFDRALMWALRRSHSEREIRDYLKRKTDDHDLVEVRHLPSSSAARRRIEALGQSLRTRRYRRTSSVSLRPLSTSTARSGVICNWLTT